MPSHEKIQQAVMVVLLCAIMASIVLTGIYGR